MTSARPFLGARTPSPMTEQVSGIQTITLSNGSVARVAMVDQGRKMSGRATISTPDGLELCGDIRGSTQLLHGWVKIRFPNGNVLEGTQRNGTWLSLCIFEDSDGNELVCATIDAMVENPLCVGIYGTDFASRRFV